MLECCLYLCSNLLELFFAKLQLLATEVGIGFTLHGNEVDVGMGHFKTQYHLSNLAAGECFLDGDSHALGKLLILAGLANGNLTSVGVGINTATKTSSYSEFASVRSVKPQRRYHLIKVNEPFCKNQIYLEDEDFDFVYNYIITRCPKVKSRNKT